MEKERMENWRGENGEMEGERMENCRGETGYGSGANGDWERMENVQMWKQGKRDGETAVRGKPAE